MIQGRRSTRNRPGGPGYQFPDEFHDSLTHSGPGILSMANSGPGTNGSQFFITVKETPWLDNRHSIFGKVVSGQEVADNITKVEKLPGDKPKTDVVLTPADPSEGKSCRAIRWTGCIQQPRRRRPRQEEAKKAEAREKLEEAMKDAEVTASGLGIIFQEKGNGVKPEMGQMVEVHYAGYLLDGTLFDTSIKSIAQEKGIYNPGREPYAPFTLPYGPQAQVIEGWKEGIAMLSVGDKARLIIPSDLGYGARGAGGRHSPDATLIFDVELVGIAE